jgi:putative molybdopterin biosynthesis protein
MAGDISYTTEEIAKILRISKLTVYDLIKKGELPAYRVGRQMRVDAADLEAYKAKAKGGYRPAVTPMPAAPQHSPHNSEAAVRSVIISGQDISLDLLANHLEQRTKRYRPLRSYVGSLNGLVMMYRGEADVVSTHLFDGDTGEYNLPYIRRLLIGNRYLVINLVSRWAGLYVKKGNPKKIKSWSDLGRPGITMVNREKGSGARVLLEEQLRLHNLPPQRLAGYEAEETNHLGVAGAVARGEADVGIGIEKGAVLVGVDFIPLVQERYDLVMIKSPRNMEYIGHVCDILQSAAFRDELAAIGGYDLSLTGKIIDETN